VVFSSFALHHLSREEKVAVARAARALAKPGGWFLNADIVAADSPDLEARIQALRVEGIVRRAAAAAAPPDARFATAAAARRFLDELEARDGDQPLTLAADLAVLRDAGLRDAAALWTEFREAVTCART
jgi:hypothetical protein